MKSPSESSSGDKSKQLDGHRRSFLGRLLAGGAAIAAVPAIAALARGEEDVVTVVPLKGKGGKGKAAGGGMGGPVANAEALAKRMIAEFDKDGDKALNQAELAAAIQAMRASQGQGTVGGKSQGGVAGQGRGGGTGGASAGGRGKGGGRGGRG
jgi:hypothetical protein